MDPTAEYKHDYASLEAVPSSSVDAVVCLEVIEHIPLAQSFDFLEQVIDKLKPTTGRILISTPNADYLSSIWASDMTHEHAYRGVDLAALLHLYGFRSTVYRIAWRAPKPPFRERMRYQAARLLTRGILQVDYARGIIVVGDRVGSPVNNRGSD
jgi:hypothetical protein